MWGGGIDKVSDITFVLKKIALRCYETTFYCPGSLETQTAQTKRIA